LYTGHLSIEQIDALSQQESPSSRQEHPEDWSHLESCDSCRALLEKLRAVDAKLGQLAFAHLPTGDAMKCRDQKTWFEVAAGTLPDEESAEYVQHAATCLECGKRLALATRIFQTELSPNEEEVLNSLSDLSHSASDAHQAASVHGQHSIEPKDDKIANWFLLRLFKQHRFYLAGTAAVVLIFIFYTYIFSPWHDMHEVQQAYSHGRPMPYRVAGAPFGPVRVVQGALEITPVPAPDPKRAPQAAAEAELLIRHSDVAKSILEDARKSGNNSPAILNDLVVAYAMEQDYTRALQISDEMLQRNSRDPVLYFNLALIYERLNSLDKSRETLKKFLELEPDSRWRDQAKAMLP
jgi:tetratricopeptide (TPR) repeat protein